MMKKRKKEGNQLSQTKDNVLFKDLETTDILMKSKGARFIKEL